MREAVWLPFLGLMSRHRAIEILAFVVLYKLADNLAQALQRPFLGEMGYDAFDRGVALATVGLAMTILGTFVGGALTSVIGLGHSLWLFGGLQLLSNLGYWILANSEVNRPLMYGALGFEALTSGTAMGAFGVLLLRLTDKRFSATQYALLSSLFGLPRLLGGPLTGLAVDAIGWSNFFLLTLVAGVPGLLMLARFVPLGGREPDFQVQPLQPGPPVTVGRVAAWGVGIGLAGTAATLAVESALGAAKLWRAGCGWRLAAAFAERVRPVTATHGLEAGGALAIGTLCGLLAAAAVAARAGER